MANASSKSENESAFAAKMISCTAVILGVDGLTILMMRSTVTRPFCLVPGAIGAHAFGHGKR